MRHLCYALIVVFTVLKLTPSAVAQEQLRGTIGAKAWRADLRFFARLIVGRHPSPFARVPKPQFEAAVAALDRQIPALDNNHVVMRFQRLAAMLIDGHTTLPLFFSGTGPQLDELGFHQYPVQMQRFTDGWFIVAGTEQYRAIVGGRVVSLGGVPIVQVVNRLEPYVSHDNQFTVLARLPYYLRVPEILEASDAVPNAKAASVVVDLDGRETRAVLKPEPPGQHLAVTMRDPSVAIPLRERDTAKPFWMTHLSGATLYVAYNAVGDMPDETFEHFCDRLLSTITADKPKRVVIDMRRNGGGSGDLNFYLLRAIARAPQIDTPDSLYVLIGRDTFSAAQLAVDDFDRRTNATFIGEPTGARPNHFGDARRVRLPNSRLDVAVSTVYHQEAGPFEYREFTPPALATPLTSSDERRGNDPALNALGTYVPFRVVAKEPLAALDVGRYLALYQEYRSQPAHGYQNLLYTNTRFESALLDAHRPQDAVRIGEMGLRDFPRRSVFTGDSAYKALAAAYEVLDQKAQAIATYKKWLQWDPFNPDALAGLEKLKCHAVPCAL